MKNTDKVINGQYGKFDTAEDLLSAYNALEAQFTKRCQLVKELQAALEHGAQAERQVDSDGTDDEIADNCAIENTDCAAENADTTVVAPEAVREGELDAEQKASTDEARQGELAFEAVMNEIAAHAAAYAEALSAVPEIMNACVALYKQRRLAGEHLPSPHGAAVLTPVKRPNSLAEAKKLADSLLGL